MGFFKLIRKLKVILNKIESPTGLPASEVLDDLTILKVIVVCPNIEGFQKTFEELSLVFQSFNDGKYFMVPDFIVGFSRIHSLRLECNQVP